MNDIVSRATPTESRIVTILDRYLENLRNGNAPDRERLLAQHPELAEDLRACLDCLEFVGQAVAGEGPGVLAEMDHRCSPTTPLGDYRLLREIGRGGMGVIYEAEQMSLGRRVALKVLPFAAMLDERQLRRFKNEAHAAAVLHHPHIVPVFGVGCERGVHFYVMQLIEGQSLAELMEAATGSGVFFPSGGVSEPLRSEKRLPTPSACPTQDTSPVAALSTAGSSGKTGRDRVVAELGIQAAEALDYSHREGVIHRDIKPSNLLVDQSGKLWVTDFGLARVQTGNNLTLSGDTLGTLRYMSPEQLAGDKVVDQRTDVYSLGLTLYELLLRRPAFQDENREQLMRRILEQEPDSPRGVDASIPPDLETVILRAIHKDRDARYQTAQELAEDLRRFLDRQPVKARRTTRVQKLRYWIRRNRGISLLTATVFALLIAFTVAAIANSWRLAKIAAEQSARLYSADINRAKEAIDRCDLVLARRLLHRYEVSASPGATDRRGCEWFYLNDMCRPPSATRQLPHHGPVFQIAFSPDGRLMATCVLNDEITVWNAITLSPIWNTRGLRSQMVSLAFRRAGQQLVSGGRDGTVRVWDVATGRELHRRYVGERQVFAVAVSPTNDLIAFECSLRFTNYPARGEAEIFIWNPKTDEIVQTFSDIRDAVNCLSFSPDGKVLAAGTYDTKVRLWNTSDWRELPSLLGHSAGIFVVAFSGDGNYLASGSGVWLDRFVLGEIKLWNTSDWSLIRTFNGHSGRVYALAFWRDSHTLLSGGSDGTLCIWNLRDSSRLTPINTILAHGQGLRSLAVSPLDHEIVSGGNDNSARMWAASELLRSQSNPTRREVPGVILWDLAFVDGGSRICIADLGGKVLLQDVHSGRTFFELEGTPPDVTNFAVNERAGLLAVVRDRLSPSPDATISMHDISTGELNWTVTLSHGYTGRAHDISPSGGELAVGSGDLIRFFDARSGSPIRDIGPISLQPNKRWTIRYSPDGQYLAYARHATKTCLLDTRSWQVVAEFDTRRQGIESIEFSPTRRSVATAGDDGTITVWDIDSQSLLGTGIGHTDIVYSLDYSSDGRRLLSASKDGTVRIWDTDSYESLITMTEHAGQVTRACFSSDDQIVASCGEDRSVVLRYADTTRRVREKEIVPTDLP